MKRVTELAHEAVRAVVVPGDTVVDATVGNGHDTLFLAHCVQPGGKVYGFDVQEEALSAARGRLAAAEVGEAWLHLVHEGHEEMARIVEGPVAAVMFNLGYLPGGDHAVTTRPQTTRRALEQGMDLLRPGGVITVVCYRGHPGGVEESGVVRVWASALEGCAVEVIGREETVNGPFLVVVRRVDTARADEGPWLQ